MLTNQLPIMIIKASIFRYQAQNSHWKKRHSKYSITLWLRKHFHSKPYFPRPVPKSFEGSEKVPISWEMLWIQMLWIKSKFSKVLNLGLILISSIFKLLWQFVLKYLSWKNSLKRWYISQN